MNSDPKAMQENPTILLNGAAHPLAVPIPLTELLDSLGLAGKPIVCEVDGRAVPPRDHPAVVIQPGCRVEVVTLAAGG